MQRNSGTVPASSLELAWYQPRADGGTAHDGAGAGGGAAHRQVGVRILDGGVRAPVLLSEVQGGHGALRSATNQRWLTPRPATHLSPCCAQAPRCPSQTQQLCKQVGQPCNARKEAVLLLHRRERAGNGGRRAHSLPVGVSRDASPNQATQPPSSLHAHVQELPLSTTSTGTARRSCRWWCRAGTRSRSHGAAASRRAGCGCCQTVRRASAVLQQQH